MGSRFPRLAAVLTGLVLLGGAFASPAAAQEDPSKVPADPPVNQAAGCWGSSCNGKDPEAMSCDQVSTLYEFTYIDVRVQLRKSNECHAAWVRVISPYPYSTIFGQIKAYRDRAGTDLIGIYGVQAWEGTHWTRMWSFSHWVRACTASWTTDPTPYQCGPMR
jgi:hypothetical protein